MTTPQPQATPLPTPEQAWACLQLAASAFLDVASIPRQPYGLTRQRLATPLAAWGRILASSGASLPVPEGFDPWGTMQPQTSSPAPQGPAAAPPVEGPKPAEPASTPRGSNARARQLQAARAAAQRGARAQQTPAARAEPQSLEEKQAREAAERAAAEGRLRQDQEASMMSGYLDHVSDVLGTITPAQAQGLANSHAQSVWTWSQSVGHDAWAQIRATIGTMRDAVEARLAELAQAPGEAATRIREFLASVLQRLQAAQAAMLNAATQIATGAGVGVGIGGTGTLLVGLFLAWLFLKKR